MFVMPVLFGIACAVATWFAAQADTKEPLFAAMLLACVWAAANLLWLTDTLWGLPLLDLAVGACAVLIWMRNDEAWAVQLFMLAYFRVTAHALDYLTLHEFLVPYIHCINALFAAQLYVVAENGGANGAGRILDFYNRYHRRSVGAAHQTAES